MPGAGAVAEWLNAHDSKSCIGATLSRVQIPSAPPGILNIPWQSHGMFFFSRFPAIFVGDITGVYHRFYQISLYLQSLYTLHNLTEALFGEILTLRECYVHLVI